MASTPTPAASLTVACPSCGSKYKPETRELVENTQLPETIAQLQMDLQTLRGANATLTEELATANAKNSELTAALAAREPSPGPDRDFIVGER